MHAVARNCGIVALFRILKLRMTLFHRLANSRFPAKLRSIKIIPIHVLEERPAFRVISKPRNAILAVRRNKGRFIEGRIKSYKTSKNSFVAYMDTEYRIVWYPTSAREIEFSRSHANRNKGKVRALWKQQSKLEFPIYIEVFIDLNNFPATFQGSQDAQYSCSAFHNKVAFLCNIQLLYHSCSLDVTCRCNKMGIKCSLRGM